MKIENTYEITILIEDKFSNSAETISISRPNIIEAIEIADNYAHEKYGNTYEITSIELIEEAE